MGSEIFSFCQQTLQPGTLVEKIFNVKLNKGFSLKGYRCLFERGLLRMRSTNVCNICLNHAKCVIMKNVDDDSVEGIPDLVMGNPSEEVVENNISNNVEDSDMDIEKRKIQLLYFIDSKDHGPGCTLAE